MRLNSQISEYDCSTTSLLNSLVYLYERDEIPIEIIKIIYKYTLDCKYKVIGDCGTSKKAMKKICKKINRYSKKHNFDLNFKYLIKTDCNYINIRNCIETNGVVIVRSLLELEHYYLITNINDQFVYIWDPYITKKITNYYNYKIDNKIFDNENEVNYSLGPVKKREVILITKDC